MVAACGQLPMAANADINVKEMRSVVVVSVAAPRDGRTLPGRGWHRRVWGLASAVTEGVSRPRTPAAANERWGRPTADGREVSRHAEPSLSERFDMTATAISHSSAAMIDVEG